PPVPAAAPGLYTLPAAPPELSLPVAHATYLVVAADGALSTGTSGTGTFPGQAIDRADVVQAFAPPAGEATADAGPPDEPAEGDAVTGLAGRLTRAIAADAPLLLADGARPAAEVIEIAADLERVSVAVAAPGDPAARALAATLAYREQEPIDSAAIRVPLTAIDGFATALAVARANAAPQAPVLVEVSSTVTIADLVGALLALQRAQVDRFTLTTPALAARGAPSRQGQRPPGIDAGRDVTVGDPVVVGPLAPAAVRKQLARWKGVLGVCYRRDQLTQPLLAGSQEVTFTIVRTGKTAAVQVAGIGDPAFRRCVAGTFRGMRFARAKKPSRVTLSLRYSRAP
ncbi:MAG TPA: hypothetical protein VMZ28_06815, partial [Kofleriaceae bacterium]|nr:hypothetical protein [Kofleriaceae bacterium]